MFSSTKLKELTISAKLLMGYPLNPEFQKKYVLGQELGSGGFGFVVSAYERETGVERAVKFIIKAKVPSSALILDPDMGQIPMEVYTLKHVCHENIIRFYDAYQDDEYYYLVMEIYGTQWTNAMNNTTTDKIHSPGLSRNSQSTIDSDEINDDDDEDNDALLSRQFVRRTSCDLFECIEQHKYFQEDLAKKIFKQIAECVAYLDYVGICHRDIKDENIVIDQDYKVKLIDFGSAVVLKRRTLLTRFYGTVSFASPEILLSRPYRAEPAEIWSLGVLLYTLLFGEIPFPDCKSAIDGYMMEPKIQSSTQCRHLINMMLSKNPENRPTIHQVLMHPWLS